MPLKGLEMQSAFAGQPLAASVLVSAAVKTPPPALPPPDLGRPWDS